MTKREGAILSCYTGVLLCDFSTFHEVLEEIMGRPVMTHEMACEDFAKKVSDAAADEFHKIISEQK